VRVPLCLCIAAVLSMAPAAAPQGAKAQKGEDSFFTGPPFTLTDLLQRTGVIADKRLSTAIERRGIDFSPAPADLERLKKAGASAELIRIITAKAPPKPALPTPASAPPARAGKITLQCQPAECDVVVNGKPRGSTSNGFIELLDLPTGENVVDFRKEGFEGQQLALSLNVGSSTTQTITLRPTAATRTRLARQLLDRTIAKLGGKTALQHAALVSASGAASLFQTGGQRTEWRFTSRLKLPAMAMIEISGAKLKWWTSLSADDSKAGGAKQMAGGPVALEMEKLVRVYRDYQPAALVEHWQAMTLGTQTAAPVNGQWRFHAAGSDGAFTVYLDPDYTLRRVVYESASGLGSGMEVLYSDFTGIDKVWYPKSMVIKFSAQQQHGLELHFSEIEFPDKLADKEFHR
jgi:uncharacterized protein DUF4292